MSKRIPTEIPPEDKITLSPLDQYRIYGKFPYHMVIYIILLIFNTLQAMITLSAFTDYFRAQQKSFINALISDDNKEKVDYARKTYLYEIRSLRKHIKSSIEKMINANDTFLNNLIFLNEDNEETDIEIINMKVDYKVNISDYKNNQMKIPLQMEYNLTEK